MEPHLCRIDDALGRTTECPRELCAFWSDNTCVLAGLRADLATTPGLPQLLHGMREELNDPREIGIDRVLLPPRLR
jgi:hypothetical protein